MLSFQDFFTACAGLWKTERTYHSILENEVERSYTEFRADSLDLAEKQQILSNSLSGNNSPSDRGFGITIDVEQVMHNPLVVPGFAISFETRSEKGEEVSMSLKALFVPDTYITSKS